MMRRLASNEFGRGRPSTRWAGRKILFGDSLTSNSYASAGYRWGDPLSGNPLMTIVNAGIQNDTLDDMWARWSTDVLAYAVPGDVVEMRAGTNSLGLSLGAFQISYGRFIGSMVSNGLKGLLLAIPPKSGATGSDIQAKNAWLAAQAAASPSILAYIDDSIDLGDGSYTYDPSCYLDGIHMNGKGMYLQGVRQAAVKPGLFAAVDPRPTSGTDTYYLNSGSNQWVKNPLMVGTAGVMYAATGVVPTDWGVSCSGPGTSAVCSIVAADLDDPIQVPWLRTVITSGSAGHIVTVSAGLGHPALDADATVVRLDMVMEMRFNNLDTSKVGSSKFYCLGGSTSISPVVAFMPGSTITKTGIFRTSQARPVTAHAANTIGLVVEVGLSGAGAISGSIDYRCGSVRALGY